MAELTNYVKISELDENSVLNQNDLFIISKGGPTGGREYKQSKSITYQQLSSSLSSGFATRDQTYNKDDVDKKIEQLSSQANSEINNVMAVKFNVYDSFYS